MPCCWKLLAVGSYLPTSVLSASAMCTLLVYVATSALRTGAVCTSLVATSALCASALCASALCALLVAASALCTLLGNCRCLVAASCPCPEHLAVSRRCLPAAGGLVACW